MIYHYECPECSTDIEVEFEPDVLPVPCSDHDHPAFSDPGSNGYCDAPAVCPECTEPLGDLYDWCMNKLQGDINDALERRAEDIAEQRKYWSYDN